MSPDQTLTILAPGNIALVLLISIFIFGCYGWVRGGVRELYGLFVIVFAVFCAWAFSEYVVPATIISSEAIRTTIGAVFIVAVLGIGLSLIGGLFLTLTSAASASNPSRVVGFFVGSGRGILIAAYLTNAILTISQSPEQWREQGVIRGLEAVHSQATTISNSSVLREQLLTLRDAARGLLLDDIQELSEELVSSGGGFDIPEIEDQAPISVDPEAVMDAIEIVEDIQEKVEDKIDALESDAEAPALSDSQEPDSETSASSEAQEPDSGTSASSEAQEPDSGTSASSEVQEPDSETSVSGPSE